MDLLVGTKSGLFIFYENTGNPTSFNFVKLESSFNLTGAGEYTSPTLADLDKDGDQDVISGNTNGSLSL